MGFLGSSVVKNLPANVGYAGSIPRLGRSHGERNGNPLQHSYQRNPMYREACWTIVHGVTKESDKTKLNSTTLFMILLCFSRREN